MVNNNVSSIKGQMGYYEVSNEMFLLKVKWIAIRSIIRLLRVKLDTEGSTIIFHLLKIKWETIGSTIIFLLLKVRWDTIGSTIIFLL